VSPRCGARDLPGAHTANPLSNVFALPARNVPLLMAAVASHGAAVAAMNDPVDWYFWASAAVYDNSECGPGAGHTVTIVGYGTTAAADAYGQPSLDYWIVKNSFGAAWAAEGGFFKIRRGVNMCGIEAFPVTASF
jgi:hypothetical protein